MIRNLKEAGCNMVDMKLSEMDKKEEMQDSVLEQPNYPYGLRLYIDSETYKKLGLKDCQIGEKLLISGVGMVMSVSAEEMKGDVKEVSVSVQIVDLSMEKEKSARSSESVIYGD